MDAIRELATVDADYKSALAQWKRLVENIGHLENANRHVPHGEPSSDCQKLTYRIADIRLFCRFTFLSGQGVLQFGHVEFDVQGGTDVVTAVLYFDQYGNVLEQPGAKHASFTVRMVEDIEGFYLPKVYEAVKKAMAKRRKTITKSTTVRGVE